MDNSRLWAVETSMDLENWTVDDWSASTSMEGRRFPPNANGYHRGSSATMLERGVGLLDGNNFTASQIIELENVIERTIQRTLQTYFGAPARRNSDRSRGSSIPDEVESARHPFFRSHQQRGISHNFASIRSSLRLPRGLHRLPSNENIKKSVEMQSEPKGNEPVPVIPLVHESTQRATLDSNAKNISVLVGGFFAYFATFGKRDGIHFHSISNRLYRTTHLLWQISDLLSDGITQGYEAFNNIMDWLSSSKHLLIKLINKGTHTRVVLRTLHQRLAHRATL
jgi:hypothetical protein